MQRTDNFNLIVVEGSDTVNLLTQMNPNTETVDEQMFKNQNAGVQTATELLNGTVHAITRSVPDASMIRFTAVSRFTVGDTFTVDGVQVSALLPSGEQLSDGAFVIGSEVLCVLKGTLLTVYCNNATSKNSERLGGELPSYYASKNELSDVNDLALSAGDIAESNTSAITNLKRSVERRQITPDVRVVTDGVKTYRDMLNELYNLIDFSKLNSNSVLVTYRDYSLQNFYRVGALATSYVSFGGSILNGTKFSSTSMYIARNACEHFEIRGVNGSVSVIDNASSIVTAGLTIGIAY